MRVRLLMWQQGGKHVHAHGHGGALNPVDTASDRLHFYDERGSTAYDKATNIWYKDGRPFAPSFPLSFSLDDGRTVTVVAKGKGGKLTWQVQ